MRSFDFDKKKMNLKKRIHMWWLHYKMIIWKTRASSGNTNIHLFVQWVGVIMCIGMSGVLIYLSIPTSQLEQCPDSATLDKPDDINAEIVRNYPIGDSGIYLKRLGLLDNKHIQDGGMVPVIVLAASSGYFSESNAIIDRLVNDVSPKLRIVLYDLGYSEKQYLHMVRRGDCEVRKFPFEEFPTFVQDKLGAFAWKPILIQLMLKEFGFVIWMDAAIYIPDRNLETAIAVAIKEGIAITYKSRKMVNSRTDYCLAQTTDERTFQYLGEKPCAFENTFQAHAGFIAVRRTRHVLRYIMRPWVSCALTTACQVLDRTSLHTCDKSTMYGGGCHKFDQSVLSIILNRLYHNSIDKIAINPHIKLVKCYVREKVLMVDDTGVFISDPNSQDCPELKFIQAY